MKKNIYQKERELHKMTQEDLAWEMGLSVKSIRDYESGETKPSNKRVRQMCKVYGNNALLYTHYQQEGLLELLPPLENIGIQGATLDLIDSLQEIQEEIPRLIDIVKDGKIEDNESEEYKKIMKELTDILKPIIELIYAPH